MHPVDRIQHGHAAVIIAPMRLERTTVVAQAMVHPLHRLPIKEPATIE